MLLIIFTELPASSENAPPVGATLFVALMFVNPGETFPTTENAPPSVKLLFPTARIFTTFGDELIIAGHGVHHRAEGSFVFFGIEDLVEGFSEGPCFDDGVSDGRAA